MIVLTATAQLQYQGVLVVPVVISLSDNTYTHGHMDISIFSLPWHCLQVWTWETFTNNLLRENQHKSPGFWLQQYRYLEWYLKVYTWVKSNQECIWTLDRIPRPDHTQAIVWSPQNVIHKLKSALFTPQICLEVREILQQTFIWDSNYLNFNNQSNIRRQIISY